MFTTIENLTGMSAQTLIPLLIGLPVIFLLMSLGKKGEKSGNSVDENNKPKAASIAVEGTAKKADRKEILEDYSSYIQTEDGIENAITNEEKMTKKGPGGIVIDSRPYKKMGVVQKGKLEVIVNNKTEHNVIIGSTGSGKTTGVIGNSIESISYSGDSMVIGDPKGELYITYGGFLKKQGYAVQVLNFGNPSAGQNFNQMEYINQQMDEGLPYKYRAVAIGEMLKLINYLRAEEGDEIPDLLVYTAKNDEESRSLTYDFFPYEKITPNVAGKINIDNGDIMIKYLNQIFTKAFKLASEEYKAKKQTGKNAINDLTKNNVYLNYKEEQTIYQGIELLRQLNAQRIKDFFKLRENFYMAYLETINETSTLYSTSKTKIAKFQKFQQDIEENNGKLTTDTLIRYLKEVKDESEEVYKTYENDANTNAITISKMIVQSGNTSGKTEDIWVNTPTALLSSIIMFIARESHIPYSKHLGSAFRILSDLSDNIKAAPFGGNKDMTIMDKIFAGFEREDVIRLNQTATRLAGDKTKSSINVSLASPLQIFADPQVISQAARTSFDVTSVADRPTAIFLNIPGSDTSQNYTILASLFLEQMYTVLIKKAKTFPNACLPRACYFLIDEFGNIPKIPNFDSKISLARSYNIRFSFVIQSLGQLEKQYKEEKETILGNSNWIYLLTNDLNTAKMVSDRIGNYTAEVNTTNVNDSEKGGKSTNTSTQYRGVPIYTPQELMDASFKKGSSILIRPRSDSYKASTVPNYKMPSFKNILKYSVNDLDTRRPKEEVNYFSPTDYEKFIVAYKAFWGGCLLDKYFIKLMSGRATVS